MKKSVKEGVLRGLSAVMASFFGFMLCMTGIVNANAATINVQLGTTNYITEKIGDQTVDSTYFQSSFTSIADLEAAKHELAAAIASEGSVLLKNNGVLPMDASAEAVTVWGLNSLFPTLGGLVGSSVDPTGEAGQAGIGILEALGMKGFRLNETMVGFYAQDEFFANVRKSSFFGHEIPGHSLSANFFLMYEPADSFMVGELPASVYTQEVLDSAKDTAAIVFLTRDSTEAADYHPDMTDPSGNTYRTPLALSEYERQMIQLAKDNSNGKVIVLLNTDAVMEIEELKNDPDIDAVLWVGLPGMYGFEGVADILAGNVNPSGHLADTYAVSSLSAPAMQNFGIYTYDNFSQTANSPLTTDNKADWYVVESEGIYVGYKYYETRYEDSILGRGNADSAAGSSTGSSWNYADEVSYPFGYGLSYTFFEQKLESVDLVIGGVSTAKVSVTNTGNVVGKDVVQLYVQAPYTLGGLEKASIQLLSFGKTDLLQPGESTELTIEFDAAYMASYDEACVKADATAGAWVLDPGDYYFAIGNGAHEALNNVLAKKLGSNDRLVMINDNESIHAENVFTVAVGERDTETYSENVRNALQDCELNNYIAGAVEYTTRTDWNKGWKTVTGISATEEMLVGLQNRSHTLRENHDVDIVWGANHGMTLAEMMLFDDEGRFIGTVEFDDPLWDQLIQQIPLDEAIQFLENGDSEYDAIPSIGIGNVYMNDGPLGYVRDQVSGYSAKWDASMSSEPTYVGPDDAYANWTMAEMPTEPVVASTFNLELIQREGELIGEDGLWANITGVAAPGVNLHRSVYCARAHEYFSEDAMLTNLMAKAYCTGVGSKGGFTTIKHFAMNHQENNRSGVSTFFSEQAARENELRAFQGAVQSNATGGMMTAFNRLGTVFAGGHDGLLTQILRNEWGYLGSVVTDANNGADYMNWLDTIYAGGGCSLSNSSHFSDESAIGSMYDAKNRSLVESDSLFQQEMQKAIKHFVYVFANSNAMNGLTADIRVVHVMTWWEKAIIAVDVALGVLAVAAFIGYVIVRKKKPVQMVQK